MAEDKTLWTWGNQQKYHTEVKENIETKLTEHIDDIDIHLSAEDVAELVSNGNHLINPDFAVNQRGISGSVTTAGYFVDGWQLVSGEVTVNADGTLTLNGTMKQVLENAAGDDVTASASAGTASYDNGTKTFTLTASAETISWAKLEQGRHATPFTPPDPATELAKCQRYFFRLKPIDIDILFPVIPSPADPRYVNARMGLPVPMRTRPTFTANGDIKVELSDGTLYNSDRISVYAPDTTFWSVTINAFISDSDGTLRGKQIGILIPLGSYIDFSAEL